MADYDLTRLGPIEFEHLTQALVTKILGANVRIYGTGRDGGREATTDRKIILPKGTMWAGYTVMQAKFRARPGDTASNAEWLRAQIRKELELWVSSRPPHTRPDNLLFLSNVQLSAVPGHGLDSIDAVFGEFSSRLRLDNYAVWHYDHLCRMLDDSIGVRTAFAGLITPGDVLSRLHQVLIGEAPDLASTLRKHAAKELLAEQWVRLDQSGSRTRDKLPLAKVAIDLTIERPNYPRDVDRFVGAVKHILRVGNRVLRPSIGSEPSPHLVLVGGPGQGKTTISQLVCQSYRVALLDDAAGLGRDVESVVSALRDHLAAMKVPIPVPAARRWPLRIELSQYADALAHGEGTSLLRYLAKRVTDRAEEHINSEQLRQWLAAWPWLIVLDGLDEVASARVREALVQRISEFLIEATEVDADLLLVATTRPRGYYGEFAPDRYEHLTLLDLTREEGMAYARSLADVRHHDDPDVHSNVLDRLAEASETELTARLMRTPLQMTIMSLLLEGRPRIPQNRHGLFDAYYETIYSREIGKNNTMGQLLENHRKIVNTLHEHVGLQLQIQAEESGHSDPAMSLQELRRFAVTKLSAEEYTSTEATNLADELVRLATERLVLLVPKNDLDVGFEVRSIQELMAARSLVSGTDEEIIKRLRQLAPSSHWRNTWLLSAGRATVVREHLTDDIISLLDSIDATNDLMMRVSPGSELAADLLDDGFAAASPRIERLLLRRAIEALRRPLDTYSDQTAGVLQRLSMETVTGAATVIEDTVRQSLVGEPPQKITAAFMLSRWTRTDGPLGKMSRQRLRTLKELLGPEHHNALRVHFLGLLPYGDVSVPEGTESRSLDDYLTPETPELQSDDLEAIELLRTALRPNRVDLIGIDGEERVSSVPRLVPPSQSVLDQALRRPAVADFVAHRLLTLPPNDWAVASALAVIVRLWLQRKRVGHKLL